jgi:hypothetical protein
MNIPTPNSIRFQQINLELEKLQDRIMEINGERTTLEANMTFGEIDETLFYMKIKCLDYEMRTILQPKFEYLASEYLFVEMLMETNVQLS